jgi:hypothetical protein
MSLQQVGQTQQSANADARFGLLRQLAARHWIEHPARHGDLKSLRQLHDVDFVKTSSQCANDFHFRPEKRMVPILNLSRAT